MKQFRFPGLFICSLLFLLVSCGGGETENKTSADSTAVDTSKAVVAPQPTTITTPQNMMVVTFKMSGFAKWKASYDADDSMKLANGIHNYVIGRGLKDSNMVMVAVKIDDTAKAKAFAKSPALKKAMQKGGVVGAPTISFVTMTFQDTVQLPTDLRSRTTFKVKDWAAWEKAFLEGAQERTENGIGLRAYGHMTNDDKSVVLVTSVLDTAKAFAYYKSDALKKRRAASGVIGEPDRFLYRVVNVY